MNAQVGPWLDLLEWRVPNFIAFLGVSLLIIVTPGQDTVLTIRNTLAGGRSGGIFTAIGVSAGQMIWPLGIATDAAGDVYVADAYLNRVDKFTATGAWSPSEFSSRMSACKNQKSAPEVDFRNGHSK